MVSRSSDIHLLVMHMHLLLLLVRRLLRGCSGLLALASLHGDVMARLWGRVVEPTSWHIVQHYLLLMVLVMLVLSSDQVVWRLVSASKGLL